MKLSDLKPTPTQYPLVVIARQLTAFAKDIIEENHDLAPMAHAICKHALDDEMGKIVRKVGFDPMTGLTEVAIPLAPLFKSELADYRNHLLRTLYKRLDVRAVVMVHEAWMLPKDASKTAINETGALHRPIRDDDRRISTLAITGETVMGDQLMGAWRIDEGDQRRVNLDKAEWLAMTNIRDPANEDVVVGRLTGLLSGGGLNA